MITLPSTDNTVYLYNTEDGLSVELFDCVHYDNLAYCRRPTSPITLQRDNAPKQCYYNGTLHLFSSLLLNNTNVSTVLHQWKSSIEKAEQYSRYIKQQIKSMNDDNKYLCECTHPQSFGKNCEYFLPIDNDTFEATLHWEVQVKYLNQEQFQRHSEIVCYTTLMCDFGLLCLDWRDVCDGLQQCMYGYDEENCDQLEFNECEDDEYRCMNGMCIPEEYFLDGDYDCLDFTDEKGLFNDLNCAFQQVTVECDDRICLPNQWSCGDGQCIRHRLIFQHISLFFREQTCYSRRDQFYMCETGTIFRRWTLPSGKCDGSKEYEERDIHNHTRNEKCIYYLKCHLTSGAEKNCPCRYEGSCINFVQYWCFPIIYFPQGNIIAPYASSIHTYNFGDDLQLLEALVVNGTIKCRGFQITRYMTINYPYEIGLRELEAQLCGNPAYAFTILDKGYDRYCYNESLTMNNHSYHFIDICKYSKECISAYRINDGIRNCADGMDEEGSSSIVTKACSYMKRHRFRCSIDEPTCLFAYTLGNTNPDCKNKYDELWRGTSVALSEMKCNRESKKDCELLRQYVEASWDVHMNMSYSAQFNTTKIPFHSFCDTFYDLGSKMDEDSNMCRIWWKCPEEQWQCHTGQCINVNWVLDGEWDCSDASDEESIFIYQHASSLRNLKLISMSILKKSFNNLYGMQPFSNICNISIEYPCFRVNVFEPLVNITHNRPCISLQQLGDGQVDCIGGLDEQNTLEHCILPMTLGRDFMCLSSRTCIGEEAIRYNRCPEPHDDHVFHYIWTKSKDCKDVSDAVCLDGTCLPGKKCDSAYNCANGEDEYMCRLGKKIIVGTSTWFLYRQKKQQEVKNLYHRLKLPRLPADKDRIQYANLTVVSPRKTRMIVSSVLSMNSSLPYVCNRGVGVLMYNSSIACFCPPQYYGDKCQFHSDRVTVILHLNLLQSIYMETTDINIVLKLLVLFMFENQTLTTHEFHIRPAIENVTYKKMIHHFLYSRSNRSLLNKRMRYFDRSKIINEHPYAIRIECYEVNMNKKMQFIAVWQYPIYFDFLPSFRLAKVLRLMKSGNANNPCSSNPCAPTEECHQLQNQRSTYVCLCPSNFTGTNCSVLDTMCANGFCSSDGLCKPNYRSLLYGNEMPYCICSLDTFGRQCGLVYDGCSTNSCQNNGTCLTTGSSDGFLCICKTEYYGTLCELKKNSVQLYFNGTVTHTGVVIQYFRLNFTSLDLMLVRQYVFITLPDSVLMFHDDNNAPEVILTKFYSSKKKKIHLISLQMNVTSINQTIQLYDNSECMPVISLWHLREEIFPIKYHYLCINDSTLLCFHDEKYICICSEGNVRVECFGYDHYLEQCSRCLGGGQCLQEDRLRKNDFLCLCPKCYRGSLCQFNTEIQSLSLDSLLAEIHFNIALLYLTLTSLIFMIGAVTNYASFVTFIRPKPRQNGVGKYLLLISILSQCSLLALLGKTIQNLFRLSVNDISCKIISYMLSVFTRCSFWLTSSVTLERLFIVLFPFGSLLKKPYFALATICITFLVVGSMHVHDLMFYTAIEDKEGKMICVANLTSTLAVYNRITLIVHYTLPFCIQVVSITILIIFTARSRSRTNKSSKKTFIQELKQQFNGQKELYVTPLIIIISSLPQAVLSFVFACTELSIWQQHTLLTAYFLSYIPQLLGFVLFVLPSTTYMNEFRETQFAKRIFTWFWKKN